MNTLYAFSQLRAIETTAALMGLDLMARAGEAIADWVAAHYPRSGRVLAIAGRGNNGGDALLAATLLRQQGWEVDALLPLGEPGRVQAIAALDGFCQAGGVVLESWETTGDYALVLDGLFGIGMEGELEGAACRTIERLNALSCPILALDCPSGLDAWRGTVRPVAVRAQATLTFIAAKPGLYTADGRDYCGDIALATLDVPEAHLPKPVGHLNYPQAATLKRLIRPHNCHKGNFGSVAVMGGAEGMGGAVLLAARAALLIGTGKVLGGFVGSSLPLDPLYPELMLRDAAWLVDDPVVTVFAVGPGLGTAKSAATPLGQILERCLPMVWDADALNVLAKNPTLAEQVATHPALCVLTPHPAEAARLLGCTVAKVQADRIAAAQALAARFAAVVVLKGSGSIIAQPLGDFVVNPTGNGGMAAAGQGDVLTGVIAGLMAQGLSPFEAATLGCWLTGRAAEALAENSIGPLGLTAGEISQAARNVLNPLLKAAG